MSRKGENRLTVDGSPFTAREEVHGKRSRFTAERAEDAEKLIITSIILSLRDGKKHIWIKFPPINWWAIIT